MSKRIIKFRAWGQIDEIGPQMFLQENDWAFEFASDGVTLCYLGDKNDGKIQASTVYPPATIKGLVIMQWTGLTDKNGKEIYEGDILRYNYEIKGNERSNIFLGEVVCRDMVLDRGDSQARHVGFILRGVEKDGSNWYSYLPNIKNIEVIANIYENPDLLTTKA